MNEKLDIDKLGNEYDDIMTKKTMFNSIESDKQNLKENIRENRDGRKFDKVDINGNSQISMKNSTIPRQKGIEPAQAVQGFGQVAESVNVNQPLVDLGSKMASEASLKYAQIQGLQDAESDIKRRGKPIELLPINLTKTDEAYRQSYNQEGMGILSQQASQTFQTFYQTAIKNPTASSLAEFE